MNTINKKGFTIIEVVLVLAIAGLIFLMVFIALPALQRNQRDSARKQEVGKIASAITSFSGNNGGKLPDDSSQALVDKFAKYIDGTAKNDKTIELSTGRIVKFGTDGANSFGFTDKDTIIIINKAKCLDTNALTGGTSRQAAVGVQLENADEIYCQTN